MDYPLLDNRNASEIYKQAIALAKNYCPEWADDDWEADHFDSDDPGLIILKLFSEMMENLLIQLNKVPRKYQLAFFELMGMGLLPAQCAKVPLTFYPTKSTSELLETKVPALTRIASQDDPDIIFETVEDLEVLDMGLTAAYYIYNDGEERKYEDATYLIDDTNSKPEGKSIPKKLYLEIDFDLAKLPHDEAILYINTKKAGKEVGEIGKAGKEAGKAEKEKGTKIDNWKFSTKPLNKKFQKNEEAQKKWIEINSDNIDNFTKYTITLKKILQNIILANTAQVNPGLGFYPFGKYPEKGNALYIALDSIFDLDSINEIKIDIKLRDKKIYIVEQSSICWEYWNGEKWENLEEKWRLEHRKGTWCIFDPQLKAVKREEKRDTGKKYKEVLERGAEKVAKGLLKKCAERVIERIKGNHSNTLILILDKTFVDNLKPKEHINKTTRKKIAKKKINGIESYWIRIKLENDCYKEVKDEKIREYFNMFVRKGNKSVFKEILKKYNLTNEDIWESWGKIKENDITQQKNVLELLGMLPGAQPQDNIEAPFIESLHIEYELKYKRDEQEYYFYRNGEYKKEQSSEININNQLLLGFTKNLAQKNLSLYLNTKKQNTSSQKENKVNLSLAWSYYTNRKWLPISSILQDEEKIRTSGDIVKLVIPNALEKTKIFEKELFWIKIEEKTPNILAELQKISPNTTWALNCLTTKDEILGSGTGIPNLSFSFSQKPVLEGVIVEVKEDSIPSHEELLDMLAFEKGKNYVLDKELSQMSIQNLLHLIKIENFDFVKVIVDDRDKIKEIWVRWRRVETFAQSTPVSRHYTLDYPTGKITFGNGEQGKIVPRGQNNVIARKYQSGGGFQGNIKENSITELKTTIPNIDRVSNHIRSFGGNDKEDIKKMIERAPYSIKNQGYAITEEDFEWLARSASQEVARAKCFIKKKDYTTQIDSISIIIFPDTSDNKPIPTDDLRENVLHYLKNRTLLTMAEKIQVTSPYYLNIKVEGQIAVYNSKYIYTIKEQVKQHIKHFLHPLRGRKNEGWDFCKFSQEDNEKQIEVWETFDGKDICEVLKSEIVGSVLNIEGIKSFSIPSIQILGFMTSERNELKIPFINEENIIIGVENANTTTRSF